MSPKDRRGGKFWNKEYRQKKHLTLSENPSEDLIKFTRALERMEGRTVLNPTASALDIGCGNGRNLIYLARTFGLRGVGYDISHAGVAQAKKLAANLPLTFEVRSADTTLPLPDASQNLVLDMMVSHVLKAPERTQLLKEVLRVLKPGGWLFFKTFLRDGDRHATHLLKEHPGSEPGSYIHPEIGVEEHVHTEEEIEEMLSEHFTIHRMIRSHGHLKRGRAHKRRSISVYAQKMNYHAAELTGYH
jgi:SAM-dependent methyltransferase